MFELSISTTIDKQKYISDLHKKLFLEVKRDGGIAIKQNYRKRSYFALAVPETKKEYYKSKLLEHIIFMIIDDYKFNFFKENLNLVKTGLIVEPFLKAISIFDAEIDKDVIKTQVDLSGEVLVDSLFYFKLQMLLRRWQKTTDIINQNQILASNSSMIEVLKYLTRMSDNLVLSTEIYIGKRQLKINSLSTAKCFKRDNGGSSNFLTEIVRLNPSKIKLKIGTNENDEVFEILSQIFDDKIYVLS